MDRNFQRLLQTLQLIPARGKISTSTIQERLKNLGYDVTTRTVQRDLGDLTIPFGLECDNRNKPYGWYWANENKRITVPGMDANQALSLRLLRMYLIDLLPESTVQELQPYFNEADNKLNQHYGDTAVKRWIDKVAIVPATQPLLAPPVKRAVHDAVTQGLLSERQLDVKYSSPGGKQAKTATVHPLGLVQHGVVQYLVATFFEYHDPRLLPLHRIESATLLDAASCTPSVLRERLRMGPDLSAAALKSYFIDEQALLALRQGDLETFVQRRADSMEAWDAEQWNVEKVGISDLF